MVLKKLNDIFKKKIKLDPYSNLLPASSRSFMSRFSYARIKGGDSWVSAIHADKLHEYECWCPDRHKVCLRQPSGKEGIRHVNPHFAHFPLREGNREVMTSCRGGGESEEHMSAKIRLKEMQGKYTFALEECIVCGRKDMESCTNGEIDIEVRSEDRRWWYDACYKSADGRDIALEVKHKHATGTEKIQSTKTAGMMIAEFMASDINAMEEGAILRNLLIRKITCDVCKERHRIRLEQKNRERERLEQARIKHRQLEEERKRFELEKSEQEKLAKDKKLAEMEEMWNKKKMERVMKVQKSKEEKRRKTEKKRMLRKIYVNERMKLPKVSSFEPVSSCQPHPDDTKWIFFCSCGTSKMFSCPHCGRKGNGSKNLL